MVAIEHEGLVLENLPEECLKEECIIGIDEAGRGPVLGPLVYGIFVCPVSSEYLLKDLGAGDSKEKTLDERNLFYQKLQTVSDKLGWKTTVLHPEHISNCMLRKDKYNLNTLSHDTVYSLIQALLTKNIKITRGYVDTLGPADKYEVKLRERFPGIKFTVCSKADSKFPVVGAASIVAKVTRDRSLLKMMAVHGYSSETFGCGYPSDPSTQAWLKANMDPVFGYHDIVRFSWSSCERILQEKAVPVEWPEEEEQATFVKSYKTLSSMCSITASSFV